jgi:diketogulonate reductase-like aldo/keto reductase
MVNGTRFLNFIHNQIKRILSSPMNYFSGYIDGLGDAVEKGLVKAVGVSNYSGNSPSLLSAM